MSPTSSLLRRFMAFHTLPPSLIITTVVASYCSVVIGNLLGWPLWAVVVAGCLPWFPLFTSEVVWAARHYKWLALGYVLVLTQGGHFIEHLAQMAQIHLLGLRGEHARGIIGPLDIEWVHVIFNTWVLAGALLLLPRWRTNWWLWATVVIAGWHEIEHLSIMSVYLTTGKSGTPGLLSVGGAIGGGLPLSRPDLHFIYNVIETVPLFMAFFYQLRSTYNEWLAGVFPQVPRAALVLASSRLQIRRAAPGTILVQPGDQPNRVFLVTRGQLEVIWPAPAGQPPVIKRLGAGQSFGTLDLLSGTRHQTYVRAATPVELIALEEPAVRQLAASAAI